MTFVLLYFLALLTVSALSTTPSVSVFQSLDVQLPLIARVNQSFSWAFSASTFNSSDGQLLSYTTSSLPGWLSFDSSTRTFQGTPSINDQGYPEVTVTAHDSDSSTSSKFSLCVTHVSPPTLNIPISDQFHPNSSSLSSVFFLRPGSALATQNPALRIPRKWSFSIGFDSDTFVSSEKNMYYELRLENGTDIPDYMVFNSKTVTLDGVIPPADRISEPLLVPFSLHASDEEGYTAAILPFNVIVADHELSLENDSLPTINITSETQFLVSLLSSADFTGVLVDGDPIQPSNISSLDIDVSAFNWLEYDAPSRTLSGKPGSDVTGTKPILPAVLRTIFNQTLHTQISLALVQSYFSVSDLPSLHVSKGDQVQLDLARWFSTTVANPGHDETDISVSYEPIVAANWMRYDDDASKLNGTVPLDYQSPVDHVTVTFTAYSHISHSTSHATFTIYIADTGTNNSLAPQHPSGLSADPHRRLVLAIVLTFSILGGLSLFIGLFAIVRRCARVEDTAVLGEEGRHAWSEKDKRWYGLTLSPHGTRVIERIGNGVYSPNLRLQSPSELPEGLPPPSPLGLGLRRVSERSQQYDEMNPSADFTSPTGAAVMRKREFLSRIKETVRQVSDKYAARKNTSAVQRPVIGKPILVTPPRGITNVDSTENDQAGPVVVPVSPTNPFDSDEMVLLSRPGSTFMTGSPSASSAEHSIPRRRPDFAPPRNMAQVHFNDGLLVRQVSTGSMG
jgi:axial budding pattern protein 2